MSAQPAVSLLPSVSVIVPTYQEAENIPGLIGRIEAVRATNELDLEVIIMDDDSGDGIETVVRDLAKPWVRVVVRKTDRGLSPAVLDGFRHAKNEVFVVMDADLSHPPETIPVLVAAITDGYDFAIGSRYISGGSTDEDWGLFRWINSKAATLLARPFTRVLDPMSGFFALARETVERAAPLNPVGYKIGLELLVKCRCQRVLEVPIHFSKRQFGHSKLNLKEQLNYLRHLRRLAVFKYGDWAHFAQFAAVGFSGTVVNLAVLTAALALGASLQTGVAAAILIALFTNFLLNRHFTFSYARHGSFWKQFVGFALASSVGAAANYATVLGTVAVWPALNKAPQIAAMVGILAGLVFNYFASRYLVFRKTKRVE